MRSRSTLILAALVVLLGAFIFFYEKDLPSTAERAEQAQKVLDLKPAAVRSVVIENGDQTVRMERADAPAPGEEGEEEATAATDYDRRWKLVEPLAARADPRSANGLVRFLSDMKKDRTVTDPDRATLGLDEPRVKVTLATDEGETVLEIGKDVPASKAVFVAVAGRNEAYQVADRLYVELTKEPGEWRDREIFDGSRDAIERITLAAGDNKVLLARRGDRFWIESPLTDRADREATEGLLGALTGLRVESFLDQPEQPLAELGLAPPQATVEAVLKDQEEPFRVEIGGPVPGSKETYYARSGDQVSTVETTLLDTARRPPETWRAKAWSGFEVYQVDTVEATDDDGTVTLTRDGADWKRGDEAIGYAAASDFLYALVDAKAERIVDRDAAAALGHPLEGPTLTVHLTQKDGKEETLSLYPQVEQQAAATSSDRDAVLLLPESATREIRDKLAALRQAKPLAADGTTTDEEEASEG